MTPSRQKVQSDRIRVTAQTSNVTILDAQLITASRWEASWDGIHYSMVSIAAQLEANATCPGYVYLHFNAHTHTPFFRLIFLSSLFSGYRRGGRDLCNTIKILPGINKCEGGYMYWCKHVYDSNTIFSSFEGGASRMLTMVWINMMCNS